ncbi:MAG: translation initiation factor IF-2 subunit beta [Candidatus Anstonellales archaeon]
MKNYEKLLDNAYAGIPARSREESRFEIPVLEVFFQGTKTIVKNFDDAVDKIRRERREIIKYLTKELALPVTYENGRMVFSGKVNERLLNEKFSDYVNKNVICKECKRPDTTIIEEHGIKMLKCEACGAKCSLR